MVVKQPIIVQKVWFYLDEFYNFTSKIEGLLPHSFKWFKVLYVEKCEVGGVFVGTGLWKDFKEWNHQLTCLQLDAKSAQSLNYDDQSFWKKEVDLYNSQRQFKSHLFIEVYSSPFN